MLDLNFDFGFEFGWDFDFEQNEELGLIFVELEQKLELSFVGMEEDLIEQRRLM